MVKETRMKQTEIGLIPYDWDISTIAEIIKEMSMGPFGSDIKVSNFVDRGVPVLNGYNISGIKLKSRHSNFVTKEKAKNLKKAVAKRGDIVVTHRGTIGQIAYIPNDSEFKEYVISQSQFRFFLNNKKAIPEFIVYFFHSDKGQYIINETKGHTGVPAIAQATTTFKKIQIPLPPLAEQEAIATALSDCDSWIDSIEAVLAKKRLIKQGAMQELLTLKEDWEEISLLEIAEKKRDLFNDGDWIESEHIKADGIRLIQTGNIGVGKFLNRQNRKYINEKSFLDLKCKELFEGDLLICRLAEPAGRACIFPKTSDYKTVTSVDVTIFRPDIRKYNRDLLMYIMCTDEWFKNVIEQVGGTTHKRISRGNLGLIKVSIPKSLSEQTRIATILSDMDLEIEALEEKLLKARQIKQGMMQELLTGRVRLV